MTSDDFLLNTFANLVGTFAGAGLAIATTWRFNVRSHEAARIRHLQGLIDRIHRSRAIAPGKTRPPGAALSEAEQRDFAHCSQSIIDTRARISAACDDLRSETDLAAVLDEMYVDCLDFLELSSHDPSRYVELLSDLRSAFDARISLLCDLEPRLEYREPGGAQVQRARKHSYPEAS